METRKVQLTGGSTYTVSLPKEWATEQGIESGSEVQFHQEQDALMIAPQREESRSKGRLDVTGLQGDRLVSAIMTMYVSGFDIIVLESEAFSADHRQTIREAVQGLVGVEVLEEADNEVVIQDLLDSSELSIHGAVTRMRLIARTMLEDAVDAVIENDDTLAKSVIERDDDVDRLWFVVSRTFRGTLRSSQEIEELGMPREVTFDYHSSARQLERIADHAAKISEVAIELETVSDEVAEALLELHEEATSVIDTAMDALLEEDSERSTELAHEAREANAEIDEHAKRTDELLHSLDPHAAQSLGLVIDSLSRSADYGGNIAETALQKAAPKP